MFSFIIFIHLEKSSIFIFSFVFEKLPSITYFSTRKTTTNPHTPTKVSYGIETHRIVIIITWQKLWSSTYFLLLSNLTIFDRNSMKREAYMHTMIQYKSDNKPSSHWKRLKKIMCSTPPHIHHHLKWSRVKTEHYKQQPSIEHSQASSIKLYPAAWANPHNNLCLMFDSENSTNHRKYSAPCPFMLIWHFGK